MQNLNGGRDAGDFVRLEDARSRGVDGGESRGARVSVSNRDSEESDVGVFDGDRLIVMSAKPGPEDAIWFRRWIRWILSGGRCCRF